MSTVLAAHDLHVGFGGRRKKGVAPPIRAVDGVSLAVGRGEIVALAGESGCGKTTLARTMLGLERPWQGTVEYDGRPLDYSGRGLKAFRRHVQLVLQDPTGALNPRRTVYEAVAEGLRIHKVPGDERELVSRALSRAGHAATGAVLHPLSARALRRPAAARGHRRRARARPERHRRRRAGVLFGRLGARRDPGAAALPARRPRALGARRHARPRARVEHRGPAGRHVPRPDRGERAHRGGAGRAPASVHRRAAVRAPRPRAGDPARRGARPEPHTARLPVPSALPGAGQRPGRGGRRRGKVRQRAAADPAGRRRPRGRLPAARSPRALGCQLPAHPSTSRTPRRLRTPRQRPKPRYVRARATAGPRRRPAVHRRRSRSGRRRSPPGAGC